MPSPRNADCSGRIPHNSARLIRTFVRTQYTPLLPLTTREAMLGRLFLLADGLIRHPQPFESIMHVGVRTEFKGEPARLVFLGRPGACGFLEPGLHLRGGSLKPEDQRIRGFHGASAG